jgi:hypothetical protein
MKNSHYSVALSFIPEELFVTQPQFMTGGISNFLEERINKKALNSKGIILKNTKEKKSKNCNSHTF